MSMRQDRCLLERIERRSLESTSRRPTLNELNRWETRDEPARTCRRP